MWWKRLKRRQRFARKRNLTYLLFLFILLSMGMGYALLNTTLGIDGTSHLANAKWDIHFDNIQVKEGSVTPTSAATITDDTTVTFSVILENPGDFYEFNVDVVNAGTINAMIDIFSIQPVLTENQQKYLDYIVTYSDGTDLGEKQRLDAGDIETLRIAFIYKEADDPDDYPDEDEDISIEVSIIYVQENDDAIDVPHPPTLYEVLEDAAIEGTYAKEYTGSHKDSFTQNPSKKVYHWYATNATNGTAILDKNNVLFAGQCWQMIRTTDTGGVKMIYNGEAEDGKCLNTRGTHVGYAARTSQNLASNYWYGTDYMYDSTNKTFKVSGTKEQTTWNATTGLGLIGKYTCKNTSEDGTCATLYLVESYKDAANANVIPLNSNSHYSQFGTLQFNAKDDSTAYVGYMYNTVYTYQKKVLTNTENVFKSENISTTYWYADSVTWGSPVTKKYNLDDPYQISSSTNYQDLVGKYTFKSTDQDYTATSVYYIAAVKDTKMYYFQLGNETDSTHTLSQYNHTYTFGESYTDNGDGTYTIDNPTTINRVDWLANYNSIGANKYVCKNAVNNICSDLWYSINNTDIIIKYIKDFSLIKFANSFTWDGSKYILDDNASINSWNISELFNNHSLDNYHYTCWNTSGECTTLSYVYHIVESGNTPYYINLIQGKSIEDAINEMLYDEGVNKSNSTIKTGVDAWYRHFLFHYNDFIEDTIFCNDRKLSNLSDSGWNYNGGSVLTFLRFTQSRVNIGCPNIQDSFSIYNPDAKLTYKVGLMSISEMNILNNSYARKTEMDYWLATPTLVNYHFGVYQSNVAHVLPNGGFQDYLPVSAVYGVRPAISLIPGIIYSSGDGSMESPYMIGNNSQ